MKRRKNTRSRNSVKRRKSRAIRPNLRNGTAPCGLFDCFSKAIKPVLKALGWK
jgi:hypothetical protein